MRGQQRESQREPGPLAERRPRPDGESQRRLLQPREGVEQTQHAHIFKQVARAGEQRQKSERPAGEAPPAERGEGGRVAERERFVFGILFLLARASSHLCRACVL